MLPFPPTNCCRPVLAPSRVYSSTGYQMIRSFQLVNFRRFKNAQIGDCKRINIIVGRNASGKTSLLEGIFLALNSSPEPVTRLRQWRGLDPVIMHGQQATINAAIWGDLFHDKSKKSIKLTAHGDGEHERELVIKSSIEPSNPELQQLAIKSGGISFKWIIKNQPDIYIVPFVGPNGVMQFPSISDPVYQSFFYAANHAYSSAESAARLSDLSKASLLDSFVDVFKSQYPNIEGLSLELSAGAPLIYAKVSGVDQKLPLGIVSGGMNKLSSILLSFPLAPKSVVLLDEVENGLYYKDLPSIWRLLLSFSKRYDVQIFASTHSGECLSAAAEVAKEEEDSFSVIQAHNGRLNQFQGEKFVWADEENIEIR